MVDEPENELPARWLERTPRARWFNRMPATFGAFVFLLAMCAGVLVFEHRPLGLVPCLLGAYASSMLIAFNSLPLDLD